MPAPRTAEHFADLETQQQAARLGMWTFLASEVLLFAGLFALYGAYRVRYLDAFAEAVRYNTLWFGTTNTFVLLTSSLTVALAVRAMRADRRGSALVFVGLTIVLGLNFLGIKAFEYADHIEHGLLPARFFTSDVVTGPGAIIFYTIYWIATGLHAVHVTAGLCVLGWLASRIARDRIDATNPVALELGAMYWHLVDMIWLFLWPLLYLTR
jgi:cytochrome c oxidase subunit 3